MDTKEVMTTEDVAALLKLSKDHINRLVMEKKIPHHKPLGKKGKTFFSYMEVTNWLFDRKEK